MNREKIRNALPKGGDTKDVIVKKANQLINEMGMLDYRIEYLSKSLNISPGNITYHYPKKDDIINTIWNNFIREVRLLSENHITPFLDIKQLYVFIRNVMKTTLLYRGVVTFVLGDPGSISQGKVVNESVWGSFMDQKETIFATLKANEYMIDDGSKILEKLCFEMQISVMLWWLNHAVSAGVIDVEDEIDHYALMTLEPLLMLLTPLGKSQYKAIGESVK